MQNPDHLVAILEGNDLLAPAVGVFRAQCTTTPPSEHNPAHRLLGTLERWGRRYNVICPHNVGVVHPSLATESAQPVAYGDVLATVGSKAEDAPQTMHPSHWELKSPCDGLLHTCDATGKPFVEPGNILTGGELLAQIEAMKVYYELRNDFAGTCKFIRWCVSEGQAVRQNSTLAMMSDAENI